MNIRFVSFHLLIQSIFSSRESDVQPLDVKFQILSLVEYAILFW